MTTTFGMMTRFVSSTILPTAKLKKETSPILFLIVWMFLFVSRGWSQRIAINKR